MGNCLIKVKNSAQKANNLFLEILDSLCFEEVAFHRCICYCYSEAKRTNSTFVLFFSSIWEKGK